MIIFSLYGDWKVACELTNLEAALELLDINAKMVATWKVAMQNHVASKMKRLER